MQIAEKNEFRQELMRLAVPLALQNLLNALVGASDALLLGGLTQNAIAAVSLANEVSFVMSLFNGTVIGAVGVLIAQYRGKGDMLSARRFLGMAVRYTAAISFLFFMLALLLPERLMAIFTPDAELIRIGADYLRIVSFSYYIVVLIICVVFSGDLV